MKFIENRDLELLSQKMRFEGENITIAVRTELYSCKMIRNDRRLLKKHEEIEFEEISYGRRDLLKPSPALGTTNNCTNHHNDLSVSPLSSEIFYETHYRDDLSKLKPNRTHVELANGRKILVSDQKTLCNMRIVLKYFYEDDSFLDAPASDFIFIDDMDDIISEIQKLLQPAMGPELSKELHEEFWHTQDDAITFSECEKYQYQPIIENDIILQRPDTVWNLNYFFINRKKKQILFLSLHATSENYCTQDSPSHFDFDQ